MTYKEILNRTKLIGDVFDERVYLCIVKKECGNGLYEISEQREFTKEEIVKTIFQLSKMYLEKHNETTHTFHNTKQSITISLNDWKQEKSDE